MGTRTSPHSILAGIQVSRFIIYFITVMTVMFAIALQPAEARRHIHIRAAGAAPPVSNYASMIVDADSGRIIESVNADVQNHPASLTKIMTLYLLFDALDSGRVHLNDRVPISSHAAAQAPSKLGLRPGQTLTVEQAIYAIVTRSANDIAVAVAEYLGGTEQSFSAMMTAKAHALGMTRTTFVNASGLPNRGQISSAHDMMTLARAVLRNHMRYYHYFSTKQFVFNDEVIGNHNHMLSTYEGIDGFKTGFVSASGFNLVASAKRQGHRLIGVIFGGRTAPLRDHQMAKLLDAGFADLNASDRIELASAKAASVAASIPPPVLSDEVAKHERMQAAGATADNAAADSEAIGEAQGDTDDAEAVPVMRAMAKNGAPGVRPSSGKLTQVAAVSSGKDWGIQVGSYGASTKAQNAAAQVARKLGGAVAVARVSIVSSPGRRHPFYRARLVGLSERDAFNACRRLTERHASCLVIKAGLNIAAR